VSCSVVLLDSPVGLAWVSIGHPPFAIAGSKRWSRLYFQVTRLRAGFQERLFPPVGCLSLLREWPLLRYVGIGPAS
jgi:hypothetical protein